MYNFDGLIGRGRQYPNTSGDLVRLGSVWVSTSQIHAPSRRAAVPVGFAIVSASTHPFLGVWWCLSTVLGVEYGANQDQR